MIMNPTLWGAVWECMHEYSFSHIRVSSGLRIQL